MTQNRGHPQPRVLVEGSELRAFVRDAKLSTYASGNSAKRVGYVRTFEYSRGDWRYEDRYVGNLFDSGLEIVTLNGNPIWTMSYRGGITINDDEFSKKVFQYLRQCLRLVPLGMPIRGPVQRISDGFKYDLTLQGTFMSFAGIETIEYLGGLVYERSLRGGGVRERSFMVVLND